MSIGMSAVLFLVSLGYGLQSELLKRITTEDTIYTLTVTSPPFSEENKPLTEKELFEFSKIEGVAEVSGTKTTQGFVRFNNLSGSISLFGVDETYPRLSGLSLLFGNGLDKKGELKDVIIGISVAKALSENPENLLGKIIHIRTISEENHDFSKRNEESFVVSGIADVSDSAVYVLRKNAKEFFPSFKAYKEVKVRAFSEEAMEITRASITARGYDVSVITDIVRQIDTFFTIVQFILGFFGVIALIVSAVGMFNTMTVALLERTQEIGIMKSIGATDRYIATLFIAESFAMGILGGALGIVIAFVEMESVNIAINLIAEHFGGNHVDLFCSPFWFIGLILGISGLVGMATGIVPAMKASKLDPLQALQYK
jgi:ABC-type lipoprotein release transport system permease subunit